MSTKFIGRLFNIGFSKETTRGVAAPVTYWIPATTRGFDEEVDTVNDESNVAVIEDVIDSHITQKRAAGSLEALVRDQSFGLILLAALGTEGNLGSVESGVKDHTFTVAETNQHQSLTVAVNEPNDSTGKAFALGMIEKIEISFEIGKFCTYKIDFKTNKGASATETVSYTTTENVFLPQHGNAYYASTYAGLGSASALTNIKKGTITIAKNLDEDQVIGSIDPADRLNQQFSIEGSLEQTYVDRTAIDTYLLADASTAIRIKLLNSDVLIGAASHPTLTIDLARAKFMTVARKLDNNKIVTQTIKFKAQYSLSDALMIQAVLRNTVTAKY